MGLCGGGGAAKASPEEQKVNAQINKQLKTDRDKFNAKIKMLLLGAGESGKSTFFKQMRIINLNGFSEEEKLRYKSIVYTNIIENIQKLVKETQVESLQEGSREPAQRVSEMQEDFRAATLTNRGMGEQLTGDIRLLWNDKAIQETYGRRAQFQMNDNADYFFGRLDVIAKEDYIPTVDDILHVRAKTTGITEIEFSVGKETFNLVDVGGQRNERRKWIHCFEDVTTIIFCAALSEYDQKLYEDETTNRMFEAIKLFKDISGSRWLNNTPIILFLNKYDLFKIKIQQVPLTVCFKSYTGPQEFEPAATYIEAQFLNHMGAQRPVYVHRTVATDTENIRFVFRAVKDIVTSAFLEKMGLAGGGGAGGAPPI